MKKHSFSRKVIDTAIGAAVGSYVDDNNRVRGAIAGGIGGAVVSKFKKSKKAAKAAYKHIEDTAIGLK